MTEPVSPIPPSAPTDTPAATPWSKTDKALLGTIIGMTALIVIGALGFIVSLFVASPENEAASVRSAPSQSGTPIERIALDGDRLAVLSGTTVVIYDVVTGVEVHRLSVAPSEPDTTTDIETSR